MENRTRLTFNDLPQPPYEQQQDSEAEGYRDDMTFDERVKAGPIHLLDTDGVRMDWNPAALREQIARLGLTQRQAADGIGVNVSALEFWLANSHQPGYRSLMKLCRFFRVPEVTFYERNGQASALSQSAIFQRNGRT
jgi:DNA-binding XRE family transcriptional regulator